MGVRCLKMAVIYILRVNGPKKTVMKDITFKKIVKRSIALKEQRERRSDAKRPKEGRHHRYGGRPCGRQIVERTETVLSMSFVSGLSM
ncbi:hypothetical protein O9H85_30055 [Paenibacillus filicis]|uniref:Uncharacterized protein n=1 Tax=Paenibacillus gyeongsangnamensis TaxID=3388067 RepID=A0ABT4QI60_9BACL|nr:hypothetical protein [Paenibacillus filicis]MCZ8516558.1 hypothetical protein [Paenibacillus filicis]